MKQNIRLALVLAGLLTVISAIAAVKTKERKCNTPKQEEVCEKGVTTFALFKVVS